MSTARLSEVVQDFERVLRARAAARPSPPGEETPRWKRAAWLARDRLTRRRTRTPDWSALGVATIATSLAQRLERVEEELLRLRRSIDDIQPDQGRSDRIGPAGPDPEVP